MRTRNRIALSAAAMTATAFLLAGCAFGNGYTRDQAESDMADVTCAIPDHPALTQEMADNYAAVNDKLQGSTIDDVNLKNSFNETTLALQDMVGTEITEDWNNNLKLACQISKDVRDKKFDEADEVPAQTTDTGAPEATDTPATSEPETSPSPETTPAE